MTLLAQRHSMLRYATALAPLIASLAAAGQAEAACTPASPINGVTVTCTGETSSGSGTTGYGSSSDTGNTYNILIGASVTGNDIGLHFGASGTVNNLGHIGATRGAGAVRGAVVGDSGEVNNLIDVLTGRGGSISTAGVCDCAGVFFSGT
jgi:hypothetical protein